MNDNGDVRGSSVEIVSLILKRMGYEANIILLPWNRAYKETVDGKVAMLFTFSKSPERENCFFFTDGLVTIELVFFKRTADNIKWNQLSDLKSYRIGYVQGYNYRKTMMDAIQKKFQQTRYDRCDTDR